MTFSLTPFSLALASLWCRGFFVALLCFSTAVVWPLVFSFFLGNGLLVAELYGFSRAIFRPKSNRPPTYIRARRGLDRLRAIALRRGRLSLW